MNTVDSARPYRLTFQEFPGYLYAFVEGEQDSYDISRCFWQEIADRTLATGSKRVLIEENIEMSVSFADVFRLASELPSMNFGGARIAFVDRFLDHNEINEFGELVAVNRGFNGAVFNDIETARLWLLDD
jgi:hypothetical protein